MVDRQRFLVVDVEPGIGQASRLQCGDDCLGIADRPARGIDEDCARLHQADLAGSDEAAAARAQNEMHREYIGAAEQLVLLDPLDPLLAGPFGSQVLTPGDRFHAAGEAEPRDCATEPPEAQNAEGLAGDAVADPGLPSALPHELMILGDVPGGAEDQTPGEFGGVLIAAARTTGAAHGDTAILQRGPI